MISVRLGQQEAGEAEQGQTLVTSRRSMSIITDEQRARFGGVRLAPANGDLLARAMEKHRAGGLSEAALMYESVLADDAGNVDARHLLGLVLLTLGRPSEALPHCEEAVRLRPELAPLHDNLGSVLRALARLDEAQTAYLEAIRLDPKLAAAHANLGLVLLQQARFDEARSELTRATALAPDSAVYWGYLADCYERSGEHLAAIPCRRRVLMMSPSDQARPHLALAHTLHELNRLDEAEAHYRAAAALDPEFAIAQADLGVFLEERGEFVEAEAAFRAAIRAQPTYAPAHSWLASLLRAKLTDADLEALHARLDDPATSDSSRGHLLFSLGQFHDARGEYTRASAYLRDAHAQRLASARGDHVFNPEEHESEIEGLIGAFNASFFSKVTSAGLETRRPVFIVGLPRSGTTLLEQVLASHSRVHGGGELQLARRLFFSLPSRLDPSASVANCVAHLTPDTVRRLAKAYELRLRAHGGKEIERVIDKLPENFTYLGLIVALFPNATIIHARRDLRDVALSCWMANFQTVHWANDPGHVAAKFRAYLRLMDHWRAVLPATIHEVNYEETVSDLEGVARRLLSAMGLEWEPACLEFHRTRRLIRTGSITQARQPIYTGSVGRWKLYEHELADLFAALPL